MRFLLILIIPIVFSGCIKRVSHLRDLRWHNMHYDYPIISCSDTCDYGILTLQEIVDVAVQQNLELFVKRKEDAIRCEIETSSKLKMLPSVMARYNISDRDKLLGSSSESLVPGIPPAPPSTSTDRHLNQWEVTFTWNLLDFGLAYLRARQELNLTIKKRMEYNREEHNLILDIVEKYWKAIASKVGIERATALLAKAQKQQEVYQKLSKKQVLSAMHGLRNEYQVVSAKVQLSVYRTEYTQTKRELAQLMGLPIGCEFELAAVEELEELHDFFDVKELEELALYNRPELYAFDIDEKLKADEARFALMQLIPGIELFYGPHYDSNSFLIFRHWMEAGLRASWNLLALPYRWYDYRTAKGNKELSRYNRLAISMGVITQVNLAYLYYSDALDRFHLASELEVIKRKLFEGAKIERRTGRINDADLLFIEAEALIAEVNRLKAYGEAKTALEQINNGIGLPLYFKNGVVSQEEGG